MKIRWSVIGSGTALALALACSGGGGVGAPTGTQPASPLPPPPPVQPPPPPPGQKVDPPINSAANFDIQDDTFVDEDGDHDQEASATVKVGEMVSWTQNGTHVHRVEFSKVPQGAQGPDSGDLRTFDVYQFRPTEPGEYVFFCRYHEYMMDVVITVVADDS